MQVSKSPALKSWWVELSCKAADTATVCQWLVQKLTAEPQATEDLQMVATCAWSWDSSLRKLSRGGVFLAAALAAEVADQMSAALISYTWLHRRSLQQRMRCFKIRPKFHMLAEIARALKPRDRSDVWNPACDCTWGDEDFVGRVSRLSRRTHPARAAVRTTQRYLLGIRLRLGHKNARHAAANNSGKLLAITASSLPHKKC